MVIVRAIYHASLLYHAVILARRLQDPARDSLILPGALKRIVLKIEVG